MNFSPCLKGLVPLKLKETLPSAPADAKDCHAVCINEDEPGQSTSETLSKNRVTLAFDFMSEQEEIQSAQLNNCVTGEEKEKCLFFF